MIEHKKQMKIKKRHPFKPPVQMVVRHKFVGTQTITDAFIPIIYEDIHRTIAADTLDTAGLPA